VDNYAEIEDKSLAHQIGNESSALGYLPLCLIFKDTVPSTTNYLSTEQLSEKKKPRTQKEKERQRNGLLEQCREGPKRYRTK
jgi:hypothetical protein